MAEQNSVRALSLTLVLGIVMIGSNAFVLSPILTDVAAAFGTAPVVIARVISVYGAATALSAFFLAGQIDRFGARIVLLAGGTMLTMALAGSALSSGAVMLGLCQGFAGLAAGVMIPAIYTLTTATAPAGQEARMLSRVLSGWALSLVAGVPLSALVTQVLYWRVAYGGLAALTLLVVMGFVVLLPRARGPETAPRERLSPFRAACLPGVPWLLVIGLCFMTAFYGCYTFLGDHLRDALGLGAGQAGSVVLAYGAGFGLAGFAGRFVDRIGPARLFPLILGAVAVVYLSMPLATTSYIGALAVAACWGLANHYGLNILVLQLSQRRPDARGTLLGLHATVTYTSVFIGPMALGGLYVSDGFAAVALSAAGFMGVALIAALAGARINAAVRRTPVPGTLPRA